MIVYHGAPQQQADEIIRFGLHRRHSRWKPKRVFVTRDFNSAAWYGGLSDVRMRGLKPSADDGFGQTFNVRIAIVAIEVRRTDLHVDKNLDNRFQSLNDADHFYLLRDVLLREFIGVTFMKTSVGFSYL